MSGTSHRANRLPGETLQSHLEMATLNLNSRYRKTDSVREEH